jgi:hypothetical protein
MPKQAEGKINEICGHWLVAILPFIKVPSWKEDVPGYDANHNCDVHFC